MTHDYQFHINGLKGIKPYLQSLMLYANCDGMGETDAKEIGETIDAAIEALEKQIPKKPKEEWSESPFSDDNGCLFQHLMCPNCGKMKVNKLDDFRDDFCPHCGQAIDWSDAE